MIAILSLYILNQIKPNSPLDTIHYATIAVLFLIAVAQYISIIRWLWKEKL